MQILAIRVAITVSENERTDFSLQKSIDRSIGESEQKPVYSWSEESIRFQKIL